MDLDRTTHWDNVYETKAPNQVSWTQEYPKTSFEIIQSFELPKTARIIDVGGGDSKLVDCLLDAGYEDVTVLEITHDIVVTNEPRKILLMYTIGHTIAEAVNESIQARFGGIGLPSTIRDRQRSVIDQGNLVTVEKHSGHTAVSDNFSVSRFPTLVSVDCCIHL